MIDEGGHVILSANQIASVYILNVFLLVIAYLLCHCGHVTLSINGIVEVKYRYSTVGAAD